ncbi:MAG: HAMP domain-containing histidine kinase [Ruminococcaceae bacterium]|nr:HAMP domain-containing histidine kinase [Oscillospiraceae bacterium]
MKHRFVLLFLIFCALIAVITGVLFFSEKAYNTDDVKTEQILAVNEIQQLAEKGDINSVKEKTDELKESIRLGSSNEKSGFKTLIAGGACIVVLGTVFLYLYFAILKPFEKLKGFAERIAEGNFDLPLNYGRSNYFGAFTWAFDSMRKEITKARACEKEAAENNKTVIATLSHDIKTPIASIRAYAEGLEANMDGTAEKRQKYISVIMSKCDEVSKLTDDLFLHSVSDLDRLKITPERIELTEFFEKAVKEIGAERGDVHYEKPDFKAVVLIDKNRLMQLTENLINNSRKYAESDIDIFLSKSEDIVRIHFRDYGNGIPDEDMPFIYGKFYRGKNCGDKQGSGLGLYIVKYIAEKSGGKVMLCNHSDGLEAVVEMGVVN